MGEAEKAWVEYAVGRQPRPEGERPMSIDNAVGGGAQEPEHPHYKALIEEAREWPRDGVNEGPLINQLADVVELLLISLDNARNHQVTLDQVEALVAERDRLLAKGREDDEALLAVKAERDALKLQVDRVRLYADERARYARRNGTVDSGRIASDLRQILERCDNCGRPGKTHYSFGHYTCPGVTR